jgi:hypothetical protein
MMPDHPKRNRSAIEASAVGSAVAATEASAVGSAVAATEVSVADSINDTNPAHKATPC